VQVPDHDVEGGSPPAYLAELLAKGSDWLAFAKSNENRPAAEQIQFSVGIGKSYFLNIALLRAFRLLWANILKSYELPFGKLAAVHSYVLFEDAEMDTNTQIIYATTQAMAAVLGGSSSVRIWPRVAGDERSFVQHIVRNLQHLFLWKTRTEKTEPTK
ncbi:MAG: methylmalonyl-CoA mutase family protein, partial [Bacteroidota bacterium]